MHENMAWHAKEYRLNTRSVASLANPKAFSPPEQCLDISSIPLASCLFLSLLRPMPARAFVVEANF